jgi:peptide/nickel transport system permease protein
VRRPGFAAALVILALAAALAAFPAWFARTDPLAIDANRMLIPPRSGHWLGTDEVGRDILARVIHGARPSVLSSLAAVVVAATLGSALGLLAAMGPRYVDSVVMRVADMLLAFPLFILAMGIVAALGRGLGNAVLAAVIVWWPQYARLIRASALSVREQAYVEGARALGAGWTAIATRHVMPNCLSPVLTKASVDVGYMLLVLSGLSFIGLGAQPPSAEWGAMVTAGRSFLLSHWWYATFPGLAIFLVSVAWNVTGEALRDVFDPKGLVSATDARTGR